MSLLRKNQLAEKNDVDVSKLKVEADVLNTFGTTKENLKAAIEGENYETSEMYPNFADVADKEGFPEIAKRLRAIAAEKHHMERFSKLLENLENGTLQER